MFTLAFPWALIALPLPLLIWMLLPRKSSQLPTALQVPFYHDIIAKLESQTQGLSSAIRITPFFIIWSLLLFAFAGPQWVGKPYPLKREGLNIMLALDLSGSMELTDMLLRGRPTSRIDIVKRAASQFVVDRKNDKIGLILFGTHAYLQTPLTYDHDNVLQRIDDATVGLAGKTTSIGDALGLAIKRLQKTPPKGRIIVLLTDGVNNSGVLDPIKAAELAHTDGIKIYTIGLGVTPDSQLTNNLFVNLNVTGDLDEDTLKEIAKITSGHYFRATNVQSLYNVYQTINRMETVSQEKDMVRPKEDYYTWPLALAFFLLMYYFNQVARVLFYRRSKQDEGAINEF